SPSSGAATTSPRRSGQRRHALRRTILVSQPPAAFIAAAWLGLEAPRAGASRVVAVVLLAVGPAVAARPLVRTALLAVAALLAAVFGFTVALALAVASRRPLAAVLVVLVGAGWPATLAGPAGGLSRGVAILLAVLVVLGGLTARRAPLVAVPVAAALALAAF